jgi:hypothetical protein
MDDRLTFILRTPALVESVVRDALRRSLAARSLRNDAVDVRTFSNLALECLDVRLRDRAAEHDAVGRHELEAATLRAAAAFAASKLARRLFALPRARLGPGPRGADVAVRDARGSLHLVRLETFRSADERLTALDRLAKFRAARSPGTEPPAIHFFSLLDGGFRSYPAAASRPAAAAPRRARHVA